MPARAAAAFLFILALTAGSPGFAETFRMWANVGPQGGDFTSIATDPADARHVAVLAADTTIYESTDAGATWTMRGKTGATGSGGDLQLRGSEMFLSGYPGARWSTDHGQSWQPFPVGGERVLLHPTNPSLMALARGGPLQLSRDGGRTWSMFGTAREVDAWVPVFDRTVAVGFIGLRSASATDGGAVTQVVRISPFGWSVQGTVNATSCYARSIAQASDGTAIVKSDCGVWRVAPEGTVSGPTGPRPDGASDPRLLADPRNPAHLVVQSAGVYESFDGGNAWSLVDNALVSVPTLDADGILWTVSGSKVFRYSAGGTRTAVPVVQHAARPGLLRVVGRTFFVSTADGLMRSPDEGQNWAPLADPAILAVHPVAGDSRAVYGSAGILGPTIGGGVNRLWFSPDAGATWNEISMSGLPQPSYGFYDVTPIGPQPGLVYATLAGYASDGFGFPRPYPASLVRSSDGGRTWTSIDAGISGQLRAISVTPAALGMAVVTSSAGLFRTRDAGATWQLVLPSAVTVTIDARDPSLLYATTAMGVSVSDDGGDHWQVANAPDPSGYNGALLADPDIAGRVFFVGPAGAVAESRDRGKTWLKHAVASPGIGTASFDYLAASGLVASGDRRAIVTIGRSTVLRLDLPTAALGVGTALWGNPDQLGWGLSLAQHDNGQVFAVWFTYDAAGKPRWYFVPGGEWSGSKTFTGPLYSAHMPARDFFTSGFDAAAVVKTRIGTMRLDFTDSDAGTARFMLDDGTVVAQPIRRFLFGPVGQLRAPMGDLWFDPSESGWGVAFHQQYSTIFATWFLYDIDGMPTWLLMPNGTTDGGSISGDIYRPSSAAGMPFAASDVSVAKAGSAEMRQGADTVFSANIEGKLWVRRISRIPF